MFHASPVIDGLAGAHGIPVQVLEKLGTIGHNVPNWLTVKVGLPKYVEIYKYCGRRTLSNILGATASNIICSQKLPSIAIFVLSMKYGHYSRVYSLGGRRLYGRTTDTTDTTQYNYLGHCTHLQQKNR